MSAAKKSEPQSSLNCDSVTLTLRVTSPSAQALRASLITEADVIIDQNTVIVNEAEPVFVDMRARWNTVMRGLCAADDVLKAFE